MAKIEFRRNERPTVGIELELGLLDAETMALASAYGLLNARLTAEGHQDDESGNFKPELMQCVLEINTDVCETIGDAERDLRGKIAIVEVGVRCAGLAVVVGGDASVFELGGAADHARRPLSAAGESAARDGAAAGDVRAARARGRRFGRQGGDDLRPHHAASADAAWR